MLAPFLFNFGLTAAAEALCAQLQLPDDTCADLWCALLLVPVLLPRSALLARGLLRPAVSTMAWVPWVATPHSIPIPNSGGRPLLWPLCCPSARPSQSFTSASSPSAAGMPWLPLPPPRVQLRRGWPADAGDNALLSMPLVCSLSNACKCYICTVISFRKQTRLSEGRRRGSESRQLGLQRADVPLRQRPPVLPLHLRQLALHRLVPRLRLHHHLRERRERSGQGAVNSGGWACRKLDLQSAFAASPHTSQPASPSSRPACTPSPVGPSPATYPHVEHSEVRQARPEVGMGQTVARLDEGVVDGERLAEGRGCAHRGQGRAVSRRWRGVEGKQGRRCKHPLVHWHQPAPQLHAGDAGDKRQVHAPGTWQHVAVHTSLAASLASSQRCSLSRAAAWKRE